MSTVISMKALLESGVHFGHRTNKWNPPCALTSSPSATASTLLTCSKPSNPSTPPMHVCAIPSPTAATVLFVGTKRQAQETIKEEAIRCGMPYVTERWLGGMLTNWVNHLPADP